MLKALFSAAVLFFALAVPLSQASAAVDPAPFSASKPSQNKNVVQLLASAEVAAQANKMDDALHQLNLAASLEPNNPYIIARLAMALNRIGEYQSALDRLRRARKLGASSDLVLGPTLDAMLSMGQNQVVLDLYPDPAPANRTFAAGMILRGRASALQVLGDSAGATAAMDRSLSILKDYDGVMTAGRIALLQGNFALAEAQADAALRLKPNDIDARILKIDLAMQRNKGAAAQQMAERLVADNPRSLSALLTRIKVYLSTDRADKAEADVDRILAEAPDMPVVRYFKSIILARHNNTKLAWDMAHSLPKEYLQVDPGVALNVANMAIAAGFMDSGAAILNVAVLRFPWMLEARLLLADLRLRQNSPEHALNVLALVQDSKDPRVAALYARAALMKHNAVRARQYIERALDAGGGEELRTLDKETALKSVTDYMARHPGNKQVKKQYALLLLGFGDVPKAKAAYEQLVREDPADGVAFNNLAWLVVQENPGRALGLAQQAVKINPNSADFLDTLGSMQMNRADNRAAAVTLQKAHDQQPDNAEIAYHLALALEASGALAKSQVILQELVKRGGFSDWDAARNLLRKWNLLFWDAFWELFGTAPDKPRS
jgi:tetratricopeptide (TPR) repeat protein